MTYNECLTEAETIRDIILEVQAAGGYPNCSSNRRISVGKNMSGDDCYHHPCGAILIINKLTEYPYSMYNDVSLSHNPYATLVTQDSNVAFRLSTIRMESYGLESKMNEETFFQLSTIHDDLTLKGIVICSLFLTWDLPYFTMQHQCVKLGVQKWTEDWMNTQGSKWV